MHTNTEYAAIKRTVPLGLVVVISQQRHGKWKALLRETYREDFPPRKSLFAQCTERWVGGEGLLENSDFPLSNIKPLKQM